MQIISLDGKKETAPNANTQATDNFQTVYEFKLHKAYVNT